MLERLIEQRSAVTVVLADVPTVKALSGQQWSTAAELTETLQPFLTATEVVSGAKYPTISMILPVVDGLRTTLRNMEGGLDILRDVLVELIDDKFADVFEDDELHVATVVDPRFKLAFFDGDEGRQRALDATKKAVLDAAEASAAAKASTPAQTSRPLPSAPAASSSTKQMPSIFAKLYAAPTATPQASTLSIMVQHELNLYIAAQTINHTLSATAWWAVQQRGGQATVHCTRTSPWLRISCWACPLPRWPASDFSPKRVTLLRKSATAWNRLRPTRSYLLWRIWALNRPIADRTVIGQLR